MTMLHKKEMNSILSKNYQRLTKPQKVKIKELAKKIATPVLSPNNLPFLLRTTITRSSKITCKKLTKEKYYDLFINNFNDDNLFRGKDDLSSMSFNSFQKYFKSGEKRPNPLRLHNLLTLCFCTANNERYLNDTFQYLQHIDEIMNFSYFVSIFKNQKTFILYLKSLLGSAFNGVHDIQEVLSQLTNHSLAGWQQLNQWADAFGKFGDVGMAKLNLIAAINQFEIKLKSQLKPQHKHSSLNEFKFTYEPFGDPELTNRIMSNKDWKSAFPLASKYFEKTEISNNIAIPSLESKEVLLNQAFNSLCNQYTKRDNNYGDTKYWDNIQFNEQNFVFIECCKILESLFS